MRRRKQTAAVVWKKADDIKAQISCIARKLEMNWLDVKRIYCVRSVNSTARAYARIWGMGRIWQETLNIPASYCIEVISEKYDQLPDNKKTEVLLHELAHIPKNFSGALVPHSHRKGSFHDKLKLFISQYKRG